eukprot:gene17566-23889_t
MRGPIIEGLMMEVLIMEVPIMKGPILEVLILEVPIMEGPIMEVLIMEVPIMEVLIMEVPIMEGPIMEVLIMEVPIMEVLIMEVPIVEGLIMEVLIMEVPIMEVLILEGSIMEDATLRAKDHLVKLAITHALAQSSKLSVYENRIGELVEDVRYLPEALAEHGEIQMPRKQMAQLMGRVFLQKSAVNLLSTTLYDSVKEYLQLDDRVELINSRFVVIQKMVKIWSNHSFHQHITNLEVLVVWLVFLEVVLAAVEVAGFFYY